MTFLHILFDSRSPFEADRFVKDPIRIRESFGTHSDISRSLPGTVPELSRKWYEAGTNNSPAIPEEGTVKIINTQGLDN